MVGRRHRSAWNTQLVIPRLGFLLFILALAIVGLPRLRLTLQGLNPKNPTLAEASPPDQTDGDVSLVDSSDDLVNRNDLEKVDPSEAVAIATTLDPTLDSQTLDLLSLVSDSTLRMAKREMPAYWELVRRASNSTFNELRELATSKTKFNDFYREPSKHRGELVSLALVVRRVTRYDAEAGNAAGVSSVYEIWGSTDQSHAWLYVFITDKLPEGFDEQTLLRKKADFAGYFLKLLAYHPGSAPPNSKPLLAPLLVGRFNDIPQTAQSVNGDVNGWSSWVLTAAIVLMAVFFIVRVFRNAEQKNRRKLEIRNDLKELDPAWFESDR
jgi:TRAP-type C4-dicarboxylate transport system permease small subunit